jgi:hypothetical protein
VLLPHHEQRVQAIQVWLRQSRIRQRSLRTSGADMDHQTLRGTGNIIVIFLTASKVRPANEAITYSIFFAAHAGQPFVLVEISAVGGDGEGDEHNITYLSSGNSPGRGSFIEKTLMIRLVQRSSRLKAL